MTAADACAAITAVRRYHAAADGDVAAGAFTAAADACARVAAAAYAGAATGGRYRAAADFDGSAGVVVTAADARAAITAVRRQAASVACNHYRGGLRRLQSGPA